MDISPRKPCKRIPEPVDEWLHTEGYFRKHAPRDPTCLFRAISEQVYLTQHYHIRVRQECIRYMRENKNIFHESISIPFESYLEQMSYFTEWGGLLEIKAMSLLYQRDFVVFNGQKLTRQLVTHNGFQKIFYLCHIPPKQYETVYPRDFISAAAFCQSIVYQTLYKDVFQMADVDNAVFKMLHDRTSNISHDKFFLKENLEIRDQLTVELYNKLEKSGEESEDSQVATKNITPFPYRIAKALDPNIYRNTDFDIWHEIKREIRNAGWIKYNSSELQVGGKCLVQMDTKEDELDKTNNNSNCAINFGEKLVRDDNGNDQKNVKNPGQKDSVVFSGHIQEMGKNEGPVVVFIEELGEKKTVPYSALKPITQKKNKQTNWSTTTVHKKSPSFDSANQKWKKPWYGNNKKIKSLAVNLNTLTTNQTDKNNNKVHNEETNQWDNESGNSDESSLSYKTYTMEGLTAYQGYAVNTSIDVMPVSVVHEGSCPPVVDCLQPELTKSDENNASNPTNTGEKITTTNEAADKPVSTTSTNTGPPDNVSQSSQNCNTNAQNEIYYPAQGITQYFAGNGSVFYPAAECNVPIPSPHFYLSNNPPFPPTSMNSLNSVNPANHVVPPVNTSAQKSMEANGSDLPLSDLATVRFFYNLGIEYFRGNCGWVECGAAQAMSFGACYIAQSNPHNQYNNPIANLSVNEAFKGSEEEASQLSHGFQQKLTISQQQGEQSFSNRDFSPNNAKGQGRAPNANNYNLQKPITRNESQNTSENRASPHTMLMHQSIPYSPTGDRTKEMPTPNKENQRTNRNSVAPRFKKNFDGRYRNSRQQQQQQQHPQQQHHQQQPQHQQQQQTFQHQQNLGNIDGQAGKNAGVQNPHSAEGPPMLPHNLTVNPGSAPVYQNPVNQLPFSQPPMYAAVPFYPTDTEPTFQTPFYPSNQNFPPPYIPHSDITDGNTVNHYPPNIYSGGENYGQPYPIYSPYMYPANVYPTISTQNTPENWYTLPGQTSTVPVPHYVQYSPSPTPVPGSPNGPQSSNVSK